MSEDKRLDEVIRVRKRPNNFVMLDKTFLEDDRLSFKAKGILAYLLSKPDNWKVIVGESGEVFQRRKICGICRIKRVERVRLLCENPNTK